MVKNRIMASFLTDVLSVRLHLGSFSLFTLVFHETV